MNDTKGSNAWRFWGAVILLILLVLLWLAGHGPSNTCCSDSDIAAVPTPVTISETPITAHFKDDKLTLSGEVGSEDFKQSLLAAAAKAVGAANVIDDITVNTDAKENDIELTGTVLSEADKSKIAQAFTGVAGLGDLKNSLTVAALEPAEAVASEEVASAVAPVTCSSAITLNVTFASASAVIASSGKSQLDEAIKCISTATEIAGHTDSTGDAASNKTLSQVRADAVKAYLIEKGIAENLLTAVGYGQEKPLGDNTTTEGRVQNRRIELNAK